MKLLLLVCLALYSCSERSTPEAPAPPSKASAVTRWVPVRDTAGVSMLEVPAEVRGDVDSSAAVGLPFIGRVTSLFVRPGDNVARGDRIALVIVPQVLSAAGAYVAATTRLAAEETRRARLVSLQQEGLMRAADTIENQGRIADAKAEIATALAMLRAAGVDPSIAGTLVERDGSIVLRSPIAGVVTQVNAVVGETRDPSAPALARIVGRSSRRVEAHLARLPPSDASFSLAARNGTTIPLRLVAVSPAVDPIDGARMAWFDAPEEAELAVGSKERVRIQLGPDVVLVPASALVVGPDGARIRRKNDWLEVEVIAASGADALVRGALAVGDAVAMDGQRVLDDERANDIGEAAP